MMNNMVKVSIIIPVLNEESYIKKCVESILKQDYPKESLELILVDGVSADRTVDIIREYMAEYAFIKLVNNPHKTVQYALNIGIEHSVGEYIVRMDAHAEYADDYVSQCIKYLEKTGADNVGGPMIARGKTPTQRVIAAAYGSPFALGGGKFHDASFEGNVDTVFLGTFKRETLCKLNMYDERLPRSEDDDLNFRIIKNGGEIFMTPEIKSTYYPRNSYKELFKQYFGYGLWKVAVVKKHKKPLRVTHLVPMLFVAFLVLFGVGSLFCMPARVIGLAVLILYVLLDIYYSCRLIHGFVEKLRLVWVHIIIHISYGLGFWVGIFKFMGTKW